MLQNLRHPAAPKFASPGRIIGRRFSSSIQVNAYINFLQVYTIRPLVFLDTSNLHQPCFSERISDLISFFKRLVPLTLRSFYKTRTHVNHEA